MVCILLFIGTIHFIPHVCELFNQLNIILSIVEFFPNLCAIFILSDLKNININLILQTKYSKATSKFFK